MSSLELPASSSSSFFVFSALIILSVLLTSTSAYSCHPGDAAALVDLFKSFGNPPALSSWGNTSADCPKDSLLHDPNNGRVTGIILHDSGLSGPISPSIGRLTAIDSIVIYENPKLTGSIPPSIGKLSNLTSLRIIVNPLLSGPIPTSVCDLQKLKDFDLAGNSLTGSIPDCIGTKLSGLSWIFLNGNKLTGPIPRSLGDTPVPTFDLSHNQLTGDASFMFGEKKHQLESIDLSYNQLEFDLSNVRFPLRLTGLILNNNRIYGRIPTQISKLGRLTFFNASYNNLCGPVPTAGIMKTFDASAFSHNKCLCGGPLQPCSH